MINTATIRDLLEEEVKRLNLFIVDVVISPGNKIAVYVDSMEGVKIEECISLSRHLEGRLDRNTEDFELEVSSPGLDRPLKLPVQFVKNIGRFLDVVYTDGRKVSGKLAGTGDGIIRLENEITIKEKGKKKKEVQLLEIKNEEIKSAKVVISLKK
jgi:ribosome maturation factor RimP